MTEEIRVVAFKFRQRWERWWWCFMSRAYLRRTSTPSSLPRSPCRWLVGYLTSISIANLSTWLTPSYWSLISKLAMTSAHSFLRFFLPFSLPACLPLLTGCYRSQSRPGLTNALQEDWRISTSIYLRNHHIWWRKCRDSTAKSSIIYWPTYLHSVQLSRVFWVPTWGKWAIGM